MIYFDNAATGLPKPQAVSDAVTGAINTLGNAHRSATGPSSDASQAIYLARERIAALFGVSSPLDVAFTSGATESLNAVILGQFGAGDHIITTELEHNSVLRPLYKCGAELSFVPYTERGSIAAFEARLKPHTKAVVCTHASNVTGDILDICAIGAFCKANGLVFVLDASQTAGFAEIDVEKAGIDLLCFTGHKALMGPQGTGGICVSGNPLIRLSPLKTGGSGFSTFEREHPQSMPSCFEAGTPNAPGIAGLLAGVEFLSETGYKVVHDHDAQLCHYAYKLLSELKYISIYGDFDTPRAPVIAFNIGYLDSGDISTELWGSYQIATRSGFHCAPLMHRALGTETQGAVRISFSWFNTTAEIDILVSALSKIITDSV